ncbi:lyase family protein [Sphingomonas prati]|uniref:3-carboxy-cis,cis-muconate cycloisomerase n=1 Tax=Sphingomonas prati TaxID=1843237 RepID=A0A7W9BUQ5_9SPHN|nr:lyase family protein [Sphingomonas prati]MBB5730269.1 3-carboxy-cis,cis-muconate cycloisomerase [Sphingomonas prati]GGE92796.1 3-carboxy-cis,cis-muconate cycloisomerase [Sphingomonas prati]
MSELRTRTVATAAMIALFDDVATIAGAIRFEVALARAQAEEGVIPTACAGEISAVAATVRFDSAELAEAAAFAGTLAIPLVAAIRAELGPEAARVLHRGATSQDIADTVLMGQIRGAARLLAGDVARMTAALAASARAHAATPAIGRTLLQDARPIGFGLRIAQWHAGIAGAAARLEREVASGAALQWGGAAGTRPDQDGRAAAVAARLARALDLADAPPWHARREGVAGIAAAVGILIGAVAKMARDVALLSQTAVGEAYEPATAGRGGSSAMPHKRNPTGCQVALSAAVRAPGLVAGILSALPAEEERGIGGWQAEGPMLIDLFLIASGAVDAMATVADGLAIDPAAIARNLAAAGQGDDIGESAALVDALIRMGRD